MVFKCYIENKKLHFQPEGQDAFDRFLNKAREGEYRMELERDFPTRSKKQNRYYWKRMSVLSGETGHSSLILHEMAMVNRGFVKKYKLMNIEYFFRITSTRLSTVQFGELITFQTELCDWLNQDKEPENYVVLPTKED